MTRTVRPKTQRYLEAAAKWPIIDGRPSDGKPAAAAGCHWSDAARLQCVILVY